MPPSRRDDLIDAAMRVFGCEGYHRTNLDRVLQEAGISRMTLYNHFKSKDELILAALRRRDEMFRHALARFVEGRTDDPHERLLAVFDFVGEWCASPDFHGCMFINAAAEYAERDSAIRRFGAEHKRAQHEYLRGLCEAAGLPDAETVAAELALLLEGAVVCALVSDQVVNDDDAGAPARVAKSAARTIIEKSFSSAP
jgi:AcrR family transcriptional regulator